MANHVIDLIRAYPQIATGILAGLAIAEWAGIGWSIYRTTWLYAERRERRLYRRALRARLQAIARRTSTSSAMRATRA